MLKLVLLTNLTYLYAIFPKYAYTISVSDLIFKLNFREQNLVEENIVNAFLKRFQISPEELAILQGENGIVFLNYEIFNTLDKIQKIHDECKTLMQSGLQTLALGLMEQLKLYQVKKYDIV